MSTELRPAILMTLILTVITGIVYPLLVTGLSTVLLRSVTSIEPSMSHDTSPITCNRGCRMATAPLATGAYSRRTSSRVTRRG